MATRRKSCRRFQSLLPLLTCLLTPTIPQAEGEGVVPVFTRQCRTNVLLPSAAPKELAIIDAYRRARYQRQPFVKSCRTTAQYSSSLSPSDRRVPLKNKRWKRRPVLSTTSFTVLSYRYSGNNLKPDHRQRPPNQIKHPRHDQDV